MFAPEERAVQDSSWTRWAQGDDVQLSGNTAAGVNVDPDSSLRSLTVYGCVNLISSTCSTLPVALYREVGDDAAKIAKPRWMSTPNPEADWTTFVVQILTSWLLDGNAYIAPRRVDGITAEAVVLHPARVNVQRDTAGSGRVYMVDGVPWRGELLHIPAMMRPQALKGVSPIEAAREAVGAEIAERDFGARFFGQGAHLSGVISVPGDLDDDQAEQLKRGWARRHAGTRKAHMPGVLTGGAEWKPISISPEQAQFLDTRRFTAAEIASLVFSVDPAMLGLNQPGTSVTYANLEQRGINFVQFALLPWLTRLESMVKVLAQPGQFAKFNLDGLLRADTTARYQAHAIAAAHGILTVNEIRALEDRPPLPGGDVLQPSGGNHNV
jgi:HK97 family phage portal protein